MSVPNDAKLREDLAEALNDFLDNYTEFPTVEDAVNATIDYILERVSDEPTPR